MRAALFAGWRGTDFAHRSGNFRILASGFDTAQPGVIIAWGEECEA
jgi:hypothetical protein